MPNANVIFSNNFEGRGYPHWDPWPNFSLPGNQNPNIRPVVDGKNHGLGIRLYSIYGVMRCGSFPGRSDYKLDLTGRWKNPGGSGKREVGIVAKLKDKQLDSFRFTSAQGEEVRPLE